MAHTSVCSKTWLLLLFTPIYYAMHSLQRAAWKLLQARISTLAKSTVQRASRSRDFSVVPLCFSYEKYHTVSQ